MTFSNPKPAFTPFIPAIWLNGIGSAFAIGVYAYLGFFSRHLADDYCSVGFTRTNFFAALWENYLTVSNRFSNFMLIASSESISPRSVSVLPALMLILWVFGMAWLLRELDRFAGLGWGRSMTLTLTLLFVFFALLQAPNRFQILYWRSAMATHFAPLVLMPSFAAFLLRSISSTAKTPLSRWNCPLAFLLAFLLGDFSEPTLLILISLLALAIFSVWMWMKPPTRGSALSLLIWSFAGAILALTMMALAPANSLRLGTPPPDLVVLVSRSFRFAYDFVLNAFQSIPLPILFTLGTPFIIFLGVYASPAPALTRSQRRRVWIMLALVPLVSYLLIVASFAPSVYGQSFPVERARFAGQVCLVLALMIEGAALGILFAQWRLPVTEALPVATLSAILLVVAAIYPLRAALLTLADVPEYRARAEAWDAREDLILSLREQGQTDLTIPQFGGVDGVKELDTYPDHWVNRCAAEYYGVNSIRAISVKP